MTSHSTSRRRSMVAGTALALAMILGGCARAEQDAPPKLTGDPQTATPPQPSTTTSSTSTTTTTLFYPGQK